MTYKLVYKQSVLRDLKRLDKAVAKRVMGALEKKLLPHPLENPQLQGVFSGLRKFRMGDYRVIYAVLEQDVVILRIGHRKEVYKKIFPQ